MIVTIKDRDVLKRIHPARVAGYLRATGWSRVAHQPARYSLWARPDRSGEILLPLDSKLGDFAERVAELLADLQTDEQRSQLEILGDIDASGCDIFRFRKDPMTSILGTIPLEEGARLVTYAHDLLLYGASAEHDPLRASISGRRPEEVAQFMSQALLGQTEVSSFVVKAQIPVPALLQADLFPEMEPTPSSEPFERRAGVRLMRILKHTRDAALEAAQTSDFRPFSEILREGATVGLYSTIVAALEKVPDVPLEIDCSWSLTRPVVGSPPPSSVAFEPEIIPPIRAALQILQANMSQQGVRLFGPVEQLERVAQQTALGDLAVKTMVDDRPRRVRLTLQIPDYDKAIAAFRAMNPVAITGDLVKRGKYWHLDNPRDLEVFGDAEEEAQNDEADTLS